MLERMALFFLGGSGYMAIELAWRGASHWTMFLAGGICLCLLRPLAVSRWPLPLAAGTGAVGVSALELVMGGISRSLLHVVVWDYSTEWGNLAGLICPRYTFYWFLLCGWVIFVLRRAEPLSVCTFYGTRKLPAES